MNNSQFNETRINHWNSIAAGWSQRKGWGGYYHRRLSQMYRFIIPPGMKVLELGCGQGDLLFDVKPGRGTGVDFSPEMIRGAKQKYPHLSFFCSDIATINLHELFDYIILSDVVNDVWDVQEVFQTILRHSTSETRIVFNFYSRLWEIPLRLAQKLKLARPTLLQNWLTLEDIKNLLHLSDLEPIRHWVEILFPIYIPFLTYLANRYLVKLWPFNLFALTHFLVVRPKVKDTAILEEHTVSIIVPARNESGNIHQIFTRTPELGKGSELIFIEGHSTDDTYSTIQKEMEFFPKRRCKLLKQNGIGKGDAVRLGFENASGEVLMILDADLTVPPEDLTQFYQTIKTRKGEFVNGVRLVYPRQKKAMRFFNLVGNKMFCYAFSWLLGQPIKDTLCGTKVLYKNDYLRIKANRFYFGDFDPFGDFDLIFGAAKLNMKLVDLPIHYQERVYGKTNIQRWKHGWLLLKMVLFAAHRIKFR